MQHTARAEARATHGTPKALRRRNAGGISWSRAIAYCTEIMPATAVLTADSSSMAKTKEAILANQGATKVAATTLRSVSR